MTDFALVDTLVRVEQALEPSAPGRSGVQVIGYGEISVALQTEALPGRVVKRMAGFADAAMAHRHAGLVERYVAALRASGITVVDTDVVVVPRSGLPPTVAVVQPLLPPDRLGHRLLHEVDDAGLTVMLHRVLDAVRQVLAFDADGASLAVDAQLSNWWFEHLDDPTLSQPVLIDVGTPFVRRDGRLELDRELILAAAPRAVRPYFRWDHTVEKYQKDYFDLRRTAVDLLGNLHKEGCASRLPSAIEAVNEWLATNAAGLTQVAREEVDRYYRSDAALLELYLRLRRGDRFVQQRLLRRRYDFVLPGRVPR